MKVTTNVVLDVSTNAVREHFKTDGFTASEVRELIQDEVMTVVTRHFRERSLLRNNQPRQSDTSREPSDID